MSRDLSKNPWILIIVAWKDHGPCICIEGAPRLLHWKDTGTGTALITSDSVVGITWTRCPTKEEISSTCCNLHWMCITHKRQKNVRFHRSQFRWNRSWNKIKKKGKKKKIPQMMWLQLFMLNQTLQGIMYFPEMHLVTQFQPLSSSWTNGLGRLFVGVAWLGSSNTLVIVEIFLPTSKYICFM